MTKKEKQNIIIFSIIYYAVAISFMIFGTMNDLEIDKKLFSPQNNFGIMMEAFIKPVKEGKTYNVLNKLVIIVESIAFGIYTKLDKKGALK